MSRTRRTSTTFVRNGAREGFGAMSCSGGRSCVWCAKGRTRQSIKAEAFAQADVTAWMFDSPEPVEATGGVDDYGDCWGTMVGSNPSCGCFTCSEVWEGLSWPLTRTEVWCDACNGDCTL